MISNHGDLTLMLWLRRTFLPHASHSGAQGQSLSDYLRTLSYYTSIHLIGGSVWMSTLHRRGLLPCVSDCWALNTTFILLLCLSFVKSWCGALQVEKTSGCILLKSQKKNLSCNSEKLVSRLHAEKEDTISRLSLSGKPISEESQTIIWFGQE